MIIAIYIDNSLIYSIERQEINKVKNVYKARFYIFDLEQVLFYNRIAIT